MKRVVLLLLVFALTGVASEIGEKKVKTVMVLSSTVPGAGQFYLGNSGGGFFALGTELMWWGGATAFFFVGRWVADSIPLATPERAAELRVLRTASHISTGVFAAAALGWRTIMVG